MFFYCVPAKPDVAMARAPSAITATSHTTKVAGMAPATWSHADLDPEHMTVNTKHPSTMKGMR